MENNFEIDLDTAADIIHVRLSDKHIDLDPNTILAVLNEFIELND